MKKKWLLAGIIAALAAGLSGCGKGGDGSAAQSQTASTKDYVYSVETLELKPTEYGSLSLLKGGDTVYAYTYQYTEEGSSYIELQKLDEEGKAAEKSTLNIEGSNVSLGSLQADGKGFLYGIKSEYPLEPDENGDSRESYYLVKMSDKGEEVFSRLLNDMPELSEILTEDYIYINHIFLQEDSVYVSIMEHYVEFDTEGNFRRICQMQDGVSLEGVALFLLENGKVAGTRYEENGLYVFYVDLKAGTISEKTKLPGSSYGYSLYPGSGYDFYLTDSYGVYGYNIGDADKTQLMSYLDSDLGIYSVYNVIPLNEKQFLGVYDDFETSQMSVGKFTKVDPKDVKDKEVVVLACTGLDWDVRKAVVKFNKSNENYRVSIQDYDALYGTETDYLAGVNRLNTDIVSGKIPDILLIGGNMPIESYISKGLFEDLKPFIEKDEELDIGDLMPNVVEAFSVDGKLYRLVPVYMINTVVAKSSDVGRERGWTVQEAKELLASKPEGTQLMNYVTRGSMLRDSITIAGNQYIDWETGECRFNTEGFIEFLEFLMQFPEEVDESMMTDSYWENYDSMWREGKVIAQANTIADFRSYNYLQQGTFGEEITMVGFPSMNEDGSAITSNIQFAMSSKSSKQEGAWEFLRYFLSEEYQKELSYGLPISVKRLNEMAEEAMKVPTYIDENGNEVEQPETFYLDGMEIPIHPMTQEEVDRFIEQISSVTNVYNYNENLLQIIEEETAAFFSGQKSAKDVAAIIQNRVQIYVNENR